MSTIVIMPGGFHPFHAGHFALYQSAKKAFPGADLYVAATNDMSERPFPFALKEKLAKLAGVEPGHFIQVKNPFQSKEITQNYNPDQDVLIFVRSEKDRNEQPKPGGTKKDGTPAYFQPWTGKDVKPFSQHAYMAYLPTVEFGPGITSATQIRKAWPTLDDRRKMALVMSLYPKTVRNTKLAQTVVQMFDQVMGGQVTESSMIDEGLGDYITKKIDDFLDIPKVSSQEVSRLMKSAPANLPDDVAEKLVAKFMETEKAKRLAQQAAEANKTTVEKIVPYLTYFANRFVDGWKRIPQKDRDNALKNLVYNIGRFLLFVLEALLKGATKKESIEEGYDPGDKITWFHSSRFPEIEGTVVGWKDGHLIVKSVDPNTINTEKTVVKYRVPKNNILSHTTQGVAEEKSNAIARTASDLTNPPKVMQHRSKRDREREEQLKGRDIAKRDDDDMFIPGDTESDQLLRYVKQHYPGATTKQQAFIKFAQRALQHSKEEDETQDKEIAILKKEIEQLKKVVQKPQVTESQDYIEEK